MADEQKKLMSRAFRKMRNMERMKKRSNVDTKRSMKAELERLLSEVNQGTSRLSDEDLEKAKVLLKGLSSEKDMMYGSMVTKKKKKKKGMMGGSMVHGGKKKKKNGMMDSGKVYTSSQKKYGGGRVFPMKGKI